MVTSSILSHTDVEALAAAGHRAAAAYRSFTESMGKAIASFDPLVEFWRILANTPEAVAGLEGRYHIRAGLDPHYRTEPQLTGLVRDIIDGIAPGTLLLTTTSRSVVAAAALRGWTQTHPGDLPAEGITWGRVYGATRILVTREVAA